MEEDELDPRSPGSSAEAHSSASPSCFRASMIILVAFIVLADAEFIEGDNAFPPARHSPGTLQSLHTDDASAAAGVNGLSGKKMVCPVAKPAGAAQQPEQQLEQKAPSSAQQNGRSAGNGARQKKEPATKTPRVPDTPRCAVGMLDVKEHHRGEVINAFGATTVNSVSKTLTLPINSRAYLGTRCSAGAEHDPTACNTLTNILGGSRRTRPT